jgi:hypothetical protein
MITTTIDTHRRIHVSSRSTTNVAGRHLDLEGVLHLDGAIISQRIDYSTRLDLPILSHAS